MTKSIQKSRIIVLVLNRTEYQSNYSIQFEILNIRTALVLMAIQISLSESMILIQHRSVTTASFQRVKTLYIFLDIIAASFFGNLLHLVPLITTVTHHSTQTWSRCHNLPGQQQGQGLGVQGQRQRLDLQNQGQGLRVSHPEASSGGTNLHRSCGRNHINLYS